MIYDLKPSDFNISGEPIPETVADRLLEYHIEPLQAVCDNMTVCVLVSLFSGFRSWLWELAHGRSGDSQHCFGQKKNGSFDENAKGAVDLTCDDFAHNKDRLLELLIEHTEYTRFCIYKGFIHCDYKEIVGRQLFEFGYDKDKEKWKWIFIKNV